MNSIVILFVVAGRLVAVCEDYKKYLYEKAVAAEEERLQGIKRYLPASYL